MGGHRANGIRRLASCGAQLTNRRIAALTGLSESNVGVILYRAVARLRADLNREG